MTEVTGCLNLFPVGQWQPVYIQIKTVWDDKFNTDTRESLFLKKKYVKFI